MFRACQNIIRELCSLLKLYYSIQNSIRICRRGVVAAYHVVWECVVEQWLGVRRKTCVRSRSLLRGEFNPTHFLLELISILFFGVVLTVHLSIFISVIKHLTSNDTYNGRTAPLTFNVAFYIFIQQI